MSDKPSLPSIIGENGPEPVHIPASHVSIQTAGLDQSLAKLDRFVDDGCRLAIHLPLTGVFSPEQADAITEAIREAQRQTIERIVRNFAQIQRDSRQSE